MRFRRRISALKSYLGFSKSRLSCSCIPGMTDENHQILDRLNAVLLLIACYLIVSIVDLESILQHVQALLEDISVKTIDTDEIARRIDCLSSCLLRKEIEDRSGYLIGDRARKMAHKLLATQPTLRPNRI